MTTATNQASYKNRRASLRRPPRQTVKFQCRKGSLGLGPNILIEVNNISENGISLYVKAPIALSEEMEILIEGYGMRASKHLARVVRVVKEGESRYLVGGQFQKPVPFADLQRLAKPDNA